VSYDSAADHAAFRAKYGLTTPLLMDTGKHIGAAYGLSQGEYPERKTFVVSRDGTLAAVIEKIDFADHGGQILAALGLA
jgi:peroxiredoxin